LAAAVSLKPTVIRFGRVGDMIMLTALTAALHHRYGSACQVIAAGPWNADIFRAHPHVEQVFNLPRHAPFPLSLEWPRVLAALHRTRPGPIYVCEPHKRQLVRVRRLLTSGGISAARCLFITDPPEPAAQHCVDRQLLFGERTPPAVAGFPVLSSAGRSWAPNLQVLDSERAARDAWLQGQGWAGRKLVLIQAGNFRSMSGSHSSAALIAEDNKSWPAQRWLELFRGMHAQLPEALIILCGAKMEIPMLMGMQAQMGLPYLKVADLSLRELFALCEAAHSMVSVDTGPAHAAAALGVPLVVLYGVESPVYWLPRGGLGTPVIGLGGPPQSRRVDQISLESVLEAWQSLGRA
jgi:heptosyltransferase-2/heptosyltransferase-3